jgi:hypothetical protein
MIYMINGLVGFKKKAGDIGECRIPLSPLLLYRRGFRRGFLRLVLCGLPSWDKSVLPVDNLPHDQKRHMASLREDLGEVIWSKSTVSILH